MRSKLLAWWWRWLRNSGYGCEYFSLVNNIYAKFEEDWCLTQSDGLICASISQLKSWQMIRANCLLPAYTTENQERNWCFKLFIKFAFDFCFSRKGSNALISSAAENCVVDVESLRANYQISGARVLTQNWHATENLETCTTYSWAVNVITFYSLYPTSV